MTEEKEKKSVEEKEGETQKAVREEKAENNQQEKGEERTDQKESSPETEKNAGAEKEERKEDSLKNTEGEKKKTYQKAQPKRRFFPKAQVHILCTYNNTIVTMSDLSGNSLGWSSSGSIGFKGAKKSTPFAATLVTQKVIEKTARYGVKEVDVFVKGVGGGREASIRALIGAGIQINLIKDITPVPHNGCRPKKPRRV